MEGRSKTTNDQEACPACGWRAHSASGGLECNPVLGGAATHLQDAVAGDLAGVRSTKRGYGDRRLTFEFDPHFLVGFRVRHPWIMGDRDTSAVTFDWDYLHALGGMSHDDALDLVRVLHAWRQRCRVRGEAKDASAALAALDPALCRQLAEELEQHRVAIQASEHLGPDARAVELAARLVDPGPKASAVSASECHEIAEAVLAAYDGPMAGFVAWIRSNLPLVASQLAAAAEMNVSEVLASRPATTFVDERRRFAQQLATALGVWVGDDVTHDDLLADVALAVETSRNVMEASRALGEIARDLGLSGAVSADAVVASMRAMMAQLRQEIDLLGREATAVRLAAGLMAATDASSTNVSRNRIRRDLLSWRRPPPEASEEAAVPATPSSSTDTSGGARVDDLLSRSVDDLNLSVRAGNCLANAQIKTFGDLMRMTVKDLLRIKWSDRTVVRNVVEALAEFGLSLATPPVPPRARSRRRPEQKDRQDP